MAPAPRFRFNARNAFLTYPRSGLTDPKDLGQHLLQLRPISYINVVRERHADGGYHIHALIQFVDKCNTTDVRFFDYDGHHPNIVAPRDCSATNLYIEKDLSDANRQSEQFQQGALRQLAGKSGELWLQALESTTEAECLALCAKASPRDYILQHDRILEYARKKRCVLNEYIQDQNYQFTLPDDLQTWFDDEFTNEVNILTCISSCRPPPY